MKSSVRFVDVDRDKVVPHITCTWRLLFSSFAALIGTSFMTGFTVEAFVRLSSISPYHSSHDDGDFSIKRRRSESMDKHLLGLFLFYVAKLAVLMGPAAVVGSKFGRRKSLMIGAILGLFGIFFAAISYFVPAKEAIWTVACAFLGIQSGNGLVVAPAYLVELAPDSARGFFGVLFEIFYWAGVVVAFIAEAEFFSDPALLFFVLIGISLLFYAAHLLALTFAEESPRWLLQVGEKERAVDVVARLWQCRPDQAVAQVDEMKSLIANDRPLMTCWGQTKQLAWPIFLGASLMAANLLTGAHVIFRQQTAVFRNGTAGRYVGTRNIDWDFQPIVAMGLLLGYSGAMTVCALLVDRVGRCCLMVFSLIAMSVFYLPIAFGSILESQTSWQIGSALFMFAYSIGPGPIAPFMVAEMFDQRSRLYAVSVCHLATQLFPIVFFENYDTTPSYKWVLLPVGVIFCAFEMVLLCLFLPETKGIPLERAADKFKPGQRRLQIRLGGGGGGETSL